MNNDLEQLLAQYQKPTMKDKLKEQTYHKSNAVELMNQYLFENTPLDAYVAIENLSESDEMKSNLYFGLAMNMYQALLSTGNEERKYKIFENTFRSLADHLLEKSGYKKQKGEHENE